MLDLEATTNDDAGFLAVAGLLVGGGTIADNAHRLTAIHIDHWFGDRWLGFRGKMLGIAGVGSWSLRRELGVPPFHPHRVLSTREYQVIPESRRFEYRGETNRVHGTRTSESNLNRSLCVRGLYAWYSGDTINTRTGAVMVYVVAPRYRFGWYAMFENKAEWCLTKSVGIAPGRIAELMKLAVGEPAA